MVYPDTTRPQLFDTWPICYDPSHAPANPTPIFDSNAATMGATGSLRLAAFVDEFDWLGTKFSICQPDFSPALEDLVSLCIDGLRPCIDEKLFDTDLAQPGIQPSCRVWDSVPPPDSPYGPYADSPFYPQCDDAQSELPCWKLVEDRVQCGTYAQLIRIVREPDVTFNLGTKVNIQCLACPEASFDTPAIPGCEYSR